MVIFSNKDLRQYSERFLCQLYHDANGIIKRPFNRYDIFRALRLGGIGEEGVGQATDEIVQLLSNQDFIRMSENSREIRLSNAGLAEAERICK